MEKLEIRPDSFSLPIEKVTKRTKILEQHLDSIELMIATGHTLKAIVDHLNTSGFNLTVDSFRHALRRIRKKRQLINLDSVRIQTGTQTITQTTASLLPAVTEKLSSSFVQNPVLTELTKNKHSKSIGIDPADDIPEWKKRIIENNKQPFTFDPKKDVTHLFTPLNHTKGNTK